MNDDPIAPSWFAAGDDANTNKIQTDHYNWALESIDFSSLQDDNDLMISKSNSSTDNKSHQFSRGSTKRNDECYGNSQADTLSTAGESSSWGSSFEYHYHHEEDDDDDEEEPPSAVSPQ